MRYIIRLVILIGGGALLASPFLLQRWPKLIDSINKLALYKSTIGIAALILGLIDLFGYLSLASDYSILSSGIVFASSIIEILVGFILGFEAVIVTLFKNNDAALRTFQNFYDKLVKYQTPLGIAAMIWALVILFR